MFMPHELSISLCILLSWSEHTPKWYPVSYAPLQSITLECMSCFNSKEYGKNDGKIIPLIIYIRLHHSGLKRDSPADPEEVRCHAVWGSVTGPHGSKLKVASRSWKQPLADSQGENRDLSPTTLASVFCQQSCEFELTLHCRLWDPDGRTWLRHAWTLDPKMWDNKCIFHVSSCYIYRNLRNWKKTNALVSGLFVIPSLGLFWLPLLLFI